MHRSLTTPGHGRNRTSEGASSQETRDAFIHIFGDKKINTQGILHGEVPEGIAGLSAGTDMKNS
jgi:hypothetical protein